MTKLVEENQKTLQLYSSHEDGMDQNAQYRLDATPLAEWKQINNRWSDVHAPAISANSPTPKPYQTMEELKTVVAQFCSNGQQGGEELGSTYGYQINHWNIVKMDDEVFDDEAKLDDDIPSLTFGICVS
jgi:hypothetical protein